MALHRREIARALIRSNEVTLSTLEGMPGNVTERSKCWSLSIRTLTSGVCAHGPDSGIVGSWCGASAVLNYRWTEARRHLIRCHERWCYSKTSPNGLPQSSQALCIGSSRYLIRELSPCNISWLISEYARSHNFAGPSAFVVEQDRLSTVLSTGKQGQMCPLMWPTLRSPRLRRHDSVKKTRVRRPHDGGGKTEEIIYRLVTI